MRMIYAIEIGNKAYRKLCCPTQQLNWLPKIQTIKGILIQVSRDDIAIFLIGRRLFNFERRRMKYTQSKNIWLASSSCWSYINIDRITTNGIIIRSLTICILEFCFPLACPHCFGSLATRYFY